ncbi:MAG: acyl carrier protein [Helicobacter sp.]|uniref:acyl carrier protein n=1 Tax=Helicobacter sp. TaxID=218 RepID=UPI0025C4E76B|nr:acyl carrier protein [Helicobacter sp.]MCH5314244.1 acyl carrier protein [Helicobacter sp.]
MSRTEFLEHLQEIFQTDEKLSFEMRLDEIQEWDSLSKMTTLAFLDREFSVTMAISEISNFQTIEDIAKKCGL